MYAPLPIDIRPEVAAALQSKRPIVAMASAPIAHSLTWPDNLEIARLAEAAARQEGVVLALVAICKGRLTVGLSSAEVEALARGGSTLRVSRRDIATAVARHLTAATTVSASMYLASRVGISLVVTGAIGGASGSSAGTLDISADLMELSRTPVAVVTAGARSVADVPHTAEILESYCVPVIGYGTDSFPAFYQRPGSQPVSVRSDTPVDTAALLAAHWGTGGAGVVVAQPTPEAVALSPDELQPALREVRQQAVKSGMQAKDLPPALMERLNRMTRGRALRAYRAILEANTRLAAQIAKALIQGSSGG
jgi:pseudouridine-5'-phosphate glycosidase